MNDAQRSFRDHTCLMAKWWQCARALVLMSRCCIGKPAASKAQATQWQELLSWNIPHTQIYADHIIAAAIRHLPFQQHGILIVHLSPVASCLQFSLVSFASFFPNSLPPPLSICSGQAVLQLSLWRPVCFPETRSFILCKLCRAIRNSDQSHAVP